MILIYKSLKSTDNIDGYNMTLILLHAIHIILVFMSIQLDPILYGFLLQRSNIFVLSLILFLLPLHGSF